MPELIASSTALRSLDQVRGQFPALLSVADYPTLTLSGDTDDEYDFVVTIVTTGGRDEGEFTLSIDGGEAAEPVTIPEDGEYEVPDSGGLTVTFADADYTEGDTYSFTVTNSEFSSVTESDPGPDITPSGTPAADYEVIIEITTTGDLGVGAYRFSLDNGSTYSSPATIPADGTDVLGASGITATFAAGEYTDDDTYSFDATAPVFGDVTVDIEPLEDGTVTDPPLLKTLQVFGTFTANVDLQGSLDGENWLSLGQVTEAGKIANGEAWKYLRPLVTDYESGDITAILVF